MTFVLDGRLRSGKLLRRNALIKTESVLHALQARFLLRRQLLLVRGLLWKSCALRPLPLLPSPSGGQAKREGSRDAPCAASREACSPPARPRSSERGGSVSGRSSGARERASASPAPSGAVKGEVARSQRTPPACAASSVASPRSSQHALRRGELGESSEAHSHSSGVSRSSDRGTEKDHRARSRSASSRDRSRRSRYT